MNITKNQKGITLIALIITIIVLLILSLVTINALTSSDSAPQKAAQAKDSHIIGEEKDLIALTWGNLLLDSKLNNTEITDSSFDTEIKKSDSQSSVSYDDSNNNFVVAFRKTNHTYTVNNKGQIIDSNTNAEIPNNTGGDSPNPTNPTTNEPMAPSEVIYVSYYFDDGILAFSDTDTPLSGKTLSKSYTISKNDFYENQSDVPWYNERVNIEKIIFSSKIAPTNTQYWFANCTNLNSIENINNLDTNNVTSMRCMFLNCANLPSIDVSNFNTSNVTNMRYMFGSNDINSYPMAITQITGLNHFNTSKVTDMAAMFNNCVNLKQLDLSSFDTSNVTSMESMFAYCRSLALLNLGSFDTKKVEYIDYMFFGSKSLSTIFVGDNWVLSQLDSVSSSNYENVFGGYDGHPYLTGQYGTKYTNTYKYDKEYARVDLGSTQPGYFTHINANLTSNNTELEYIASTTSGGQYINTNYMPNQNTKVDFVFEFASTISDYYNIIGERNADFSSAFQIWVQDNGDISNRYNQESYNTFTPTASIGNSKINFKMENGSLTIDNITNNKKDEFTFTQNSTSFSAIFPLMIGKSINGGDILGSLYPYKIYSFKIYEGNTLVRDFIPVKNTYLNNKTGLYDRVNSVFYPGLGDENFTAGNEK